jgi:hypothetical protein
MLCVDWCTYSLYISEDVRDPHGGAGFLELVDKLSPDESCAFLITRI